MILYGYSEPFSWTIALAENVLLGVLTVRRLHGSRCAVGEHPE